MSFPLLLAKCWLKHSMPPSTKSKQKKIATQIANLEHDRVATLESSYQTVIQHVSGHFTHHWTCHACQYKNTIITLPGDHPCGILECHSCSHVCCSLCVFSSKLRGCFAEGAEFHLKGVEHGELPYICVCRKCGLSHRAVVIRVAPIVGNENTEMMYWGFGKRKCACGAKQKPWKPWIGFKLREMPVFEGDVRKLRSVLRHEMNSV